MLKKKKKEMPSPEAPSHAYVYTHTHTPHSYSRRCLEDSAWDRKSQKVATYGAKLRVAGGHRKSCSCTKATGYGKTLATKQLSLCKEKCCWVTATKCASWQVLATLPPPLWPGRDRLHLSRGQGSCWPFAGSGS